MPVFAAAKMGSGSNVTCNDLFGGTLFIAFSACLEFDGLLIVRALAVPPRK